MGKIIIPTFRIETSFISYVSKRKEILSTAWKVKEYGTPSATNIKKWIDAMNASMQQGGSNAHLKNGQSDYSSAKIIRQSNNEIVASFSYPSFVTV